MARGRKTGGRTKGTPNKIKGEMRAVLEVIVSRQLEQLDDMIEETRHGIEIEKQMPDGQVVVGRLNADPGRAAKLVLEAAEYCLPKKRETKAEVSGADGGPVVVEIVKLTDKE